MSTPTNQQAVFNFFKRSVNNEIDGSGDTDGRGRFSRVAGRVDAVHPLGVCFSTHNFMIDVFHSTRCGDRLKTRIRLDISALDDVTRSAEGLRPRNNRPFMSRFDSNPLWRGCTWGVYRSTECNDKFVPLSLQQYLKLIRFVWIHVDEDMPMLSASLFWRCLIQVPVYAIIVAGSLHAASMRTTGTTNDANHRFHDFNSSSSFSTDQNDVMIVF